MAEIQYLDDLLDVEVPAPNDGDILYWDAAAAKWKAKAFVPGGGTVERLTRSSSDDCNVRWNGAAWLFTLNTAYIRAGYWSTSYMAYGGGMRFLNIYIPKDATIVRAYLKLTCNVSDNVTTVRSRIHGEQNADPLTFSDYPDYNARVRTDAVVDWDEIPAWTAGELYQSPGIKSIIQEIVNLAAWASGKPIVIFWDDHEQRSDAVAACQRRGHSWDGHTPNPPMLYIEWVP